MTRDMNILYVEDELMVREGVAFVLEIENYDVHTAEDGQFAWEMLDQVNPDLLITDINMPRMDGLELIEKIRSSGKAELPVIVTSAFADKDFLAQASNLKISSYLTKPFSLEDLTSAINELNA